MRRKIFDKKGPSGGAKPNHPLLSVINKDGLSRLRSGHPWLRKKDLATDSLFPKDSSLVHLGEHWFLWDPDSFLSLRRIGPSTRNWNFNKSLKGLVQEGKWDDLSSWMEDHFSHLWEYKRKLVNDDSCFRWVFSDADLLPGLTIDVYADTAVLEIGHPFWQMHKKALLDLLARAGGRPELKWVDSQSPSIEIQGRWITWNGVEWWMNPGSSQKTGSYLDQKLNHLKASAWAKKLNLKTAWDLCSFEGGFSLHLASAGMKILAVDQSQKALEVLEKNSQKNQVTQNIRAQKEDVFVFLRQNFDLKNKVDMIVLDPPSIVKSFSELEGGMRGLKELVLRSLHCLNPAGLLVLCTCSHHLSAERVEKVIAEAAHDARRQVKILEMGGPSPDHAGLTTCPETLYLRSYFLSVF